MKVNAIQGTSGDVNAQANASSVGQGEDFSSFMPVSASLEEIFEEASRTYNVPKNLIKAIAKAESDFNPNATSGAGAQGIMQLMPGTARELGVTDAYDPYQNIMGGTKYISQMLEKFDGNVSFALAAYNAGSANVAKYGGVPPFKETQNYVAKILGFLKEGVAVPDASYPVGGAGGEAFPSGAATLAASVQEARDNYYQGILDQLFSYEEYLHFIDLYTKLQEAQQEKEKEEEEQQREESDSYQAYKDIRYSPAVIHLL